MTLLYLTCREREDVTVGLSPLPVMFPNVDVVGPLERILPRCPGGLNSRLPQSFRLAKGTSPFSTHVSMVLTPDADRRGDDRRGTDRSGPERGRDGEKKSLDECLVAQGPEDELRYFHRQAFVAFF